MTAWRAAMLPSLMGTTGLVLQRQQVILGVGFCDSSGEGRQQTCWLCSCVVRATVAASLCLLACKERMVCSDVVGAVASSQQRSTLIALPLLQPCACLCLAVCLVCAFRVSVCLSTARQLHVLLAGHPALRIYKGDAGPPAVVKQEEAAVGKALKAAFRQVSRRHACVSVCLSVCLFLMWCGLCLFGQFQRVDGGRIEPEPG